MYVLMSFPPKHGDVSCCFARLFFFAATLNSVVSSTSSIVAIGLLSNELSFDEQLALNFSFHYANDFLLSSQSVQLVGVHGPPSHSQFDATRTACWHLSNGVSAILGVLDSSTTRAVALLAETFRVPFFAPQTTNPLFASPAKYPYLIRQLPPDAIQSEAIADVIEYFGWKRITILTSNTEDGLNGLVRLQNIASVRKWTVYSVQSFEARSNVRDIDARTELLHISSSGVRIIVLHCAGAEGVQVLLQAAELGMASAGWQWIVTDRIASTDQLFKSGAASGLLQGLLGTALAVRPSAFVDQVTKQWNTQTGEQVITSSQAAIMDAVFSIAYASASSLSSLEAESLRCSITSSPWSKGAAALVAFATVSGEGMMGTIEYSNQQPAQMEYSLLSLQVDRWEKVGMWTENSTPHQHLRMLQKIVLKMGATENVSDFASGLVNKTLRIVFLFESGFIDPASGITKDAIKNETNVPVEWLQGLCINLLLKLQQSIGFNFTLYLSPDELFGGKDSVTGIWNGMVGELVERRADVAVASLTINRARKLDIDFTTPYIDLGLQFMTKKREMVQDSFRFFAPLSPSLWGYIAGTLFLVSFALTIANKLSTYDYHGGFVQEKHEVSSDWKEYKKYLVVKKKSFRAMNFPNSVWLSVATLFQQGSEMYPLSMSGRISATLWFFLSLLVIATYTANLSAFLTQSRLKEDINSLQELIDQSDIKFGTIESSSTLSFFAESSVPLYQQVSDYVKVYKTTVPTTDEGIAKTRDGGYAIIWDSLVLEYEVQKPPCVLRLGGSVFGKLGYGFGLQKNSPFLEELSLHITQLRESGFIGDLKQKWLMFPGGCAAGDQLNELSRLAVTNVLGVFYIIYAGIAFSVVVLVVEWVVACAVDVRQQDIIPHHPTTWMEALHFRRKRLWQELVDDFSIAVIKRKRPKVAELGAVEQPRQRVATARPDKLSTRTACENVSVNHRSIRACLCGEHLSSSDNDWTEQRRDIPVSTASVSV